MPSRREVRNTYDRIAAHFAKTRPEPWPEIATFLDGRSGDVGLDIGVGNARHAELLSERVGRVVGVDVSRAFLAEAAERSRDQEFEIELVQGDATALPFADTSIDVAVYVATLHHLPSKALRIRSLDELARVLAPGASAIVSVWSTSHESFDRADAFDTTVDWTLPDGETVPRYYHVYDSDDFADDLRASRLDVASTFEASGNCYGIVEGPDPNGTRDGRP